MEPIDDIDAAKKKRRTMLENMQRSSAMFQAKATKAESQATERAKAKQQEQPADTGDQMDFSSEFSNQDTGLSSDKGADVLSGWEELLEDDDWMDEDEEESEDEEGSGGGYFEESAEEDEESPETTGTAWKPMKKPGFLPRPATNPPPSASQDAAKKLWGAQGKKPEAEASAAPPEAAPPTPPPPPKPKPTSSGTPVLNSGTPNLGSGSPSFGRGAGAGSDSVGAFSATRRGGWSALPSKEDVATPRVRPLNGVPLPNRGQLQHVDSKIVSAAQLLISTPADEPGYEECVRLLERFGLGAIRLMSKAKVKIHILDEPGFKKHPELLEMGLEKEEFPVDGAYLVKSKTCLIDRRCLTEKPQFFHPALYYFAHALDHAQGGEDFSSRKAAAVLACFDASCQGLHGADFVDELAAADPVRYFARSVAIYLGRDDCTDPIWTYQELIDFDRSMYDYLQYLFARFAV